MGKTQTVPITDHFELMMISALRYAIGRETYMPEITIHYIKNLVPKFTERTLFVMRRDIEEEVRRYERMGHELYMKKEWLGLQQEIHEAYRKLVPNENV